MENGAVENRLEGACFEEVDHACEEFEAWLHEADVFMKALAGGVLGKSPSGWVEPYITETRIYDTAMRIFVWAKVHQGLYLATHTQERPEQALDFTIQFPRTGEIFSPFVLVKDGATKSDPYQIPGDFVVNVPRCLLQMCVFQMCCYALEFGESPIDFSGYHNGKVLALECRFKKCSGKAWYEQKQSWLEVPPVLEGVAPGVRGMHELIRKGLGGSFGMFNTYRGAKEGSYLMSVAIPMH